MKMAPPKDGAADFQVWGFLLPLLDPFERFGAEGTACVVEGIGVEGPVFMVEGFGADGGSVGTERLNALGWTATCDTFGVPEGLSTGEATECGGRNSGRSIKNFVKTLIALVVAMSNGGVGVA